MADLNGSDFDHGFASQVDSTWAQQPGAPVAAGQPSSLAGGPAVAPAAGDVSPSLGGDPAYLAFQRALGLEKSNAESGTQTSIDALNRQQANRLADIGTAGGYARDRIAGGMEARGLYRSGETEQKLGQQRQAEGSQVSALQDDTANRIAALQQALGQTETGYDTRAAEQQLAAAQQQQMQAEQDRINASLYAPAPAAPQDDITALLAQLAAAQQPAVAPAPAPLAPLPRPAAAAPVVNSKTRLGRAN